MSGLRAGRRRTAIAAEPVIPVNLAGATGDEALATLERGLSDLATSFNEQDASLYLADVSLIVGQNTISHGLGRKPEMVYVAPSSASASFGWAWDPNQPGNPRPEQITHVTVAGVPMTARIEVR